MEVKVGKVWNDSHLRELRVAFADESYVEFESIDGSTVCIEKSAVYYLKSLKLLVDVQPQHLSDLEIVQKALDKTGFDMLCTGGSFVVADHCSEEIGVDGHHFNDMNELLTWAKQTIGEE